MRAGWEAFRESTENPFSGIERFEDMPFGTPDELIAARIDGSAYVDLKEAALRAHATQIPSTSWLFTLAKGFDEKELGSEFYTLAEGVRGPGGGPHGWEEDLFAGVTLSG
ncbi:MAG: hypothetical protein H0T78_06955 [Longispora sp.]|nr:hypothetical protein [Longispora sp. (in: high G+C Gram-positive bacteria)]